MPSTKSDPTPRKATAFKPQKIMRRVLFALLPAFLGGIYFFGWRVAGILLTVTVCGLATEYGLARRRGDPLTESALVTCCLLALSLPPTIPFWMAGIGALVALSFGKEFFVAKNLVTMIEPGGRGAFDSSNQS